MSKGSPQAIAGHLRIIKSMKARRWIPNLVLSQSNRCVCAWSERFESSDSGLDGCLLLSIRQSHVAPCHWAKGEQNATDMSGLHIPKTHSNLPRRMPQHIKLNSYIHISWPGYFHYVLAISHERLSMYFKWLQHLTSGLPTATSLRLSTRSPTTLRLHKTAGVLDTCTSREPCLA